MAMLGHTQACALQKPSQILDGHCHHSPYIPDLALSYYLFVLLKKACEDIIMLMMRHYKTPCASGCREGTETFTRWKYSSSKVEEFCNKDGNYTEK
jgi:hypothetical protein